MTKWEYAELEVTIGGPITGVKGKVTVFKTDGKFDERTGNYGELLAMLGEYRWEVAAGSARIETGLGDKHKINYLLKRPKLEE